MKVDCMHFSRLKILSDEERYDSALTAMTVISSHEDI